jgi:hypothetical protein
MYATLIFGIITLFGVFRLWLKATCGKFESKVNEEMQNNSIDLLFIQSKQFRLEWMVRQF